MKIHEYQAKQLLKAYNISIPNGKIARKTEEVYEIARDIGNFPLVVKAQVHSGGRGRAGGIKICRSSDELAEAATKMLGSILKTEQTGEDGKPVDSVLIEEVYETEREFYLGFTIDRQRACISMIVSAEGGMEIEKIASASPEKISIQLIDPFLGLKQFQINRTLLSLGLNLSDARRIGSIAQNLYRLFIDKDCSLAEINPLIVAKDKRITALDAKINFDDNALYRHEDVISLRDLNQENHLEVEASRYNLNYIKLKGNVGCMVNGAGLAMATMDLIKLVGAEPANFLDVGGGATSQMVKEGLKILISDKDVRVILINIFGGILRCDTLANGVVEAAKELKISLPMVIRLEGTNVDEGRRILAESGLTFTVASGMGEAAIKVAEALKDSMGNRA